MPEQNQQPDGSEPKPEPKSEQQPSGSPVWHRPAPEIPEVLRNPPAPKPAAKPRRRLQLIPETSGTDMRAIGLGLDFAAMVGASVLLGWGADRFFGTTRGILIGLGVGLVVAGWHFFKGARRLSDTLHGTKAPQNTKPTSAPPTSLHPSANRPDLSQDSPPDPPAGTL